MFYNLKIAFRNLRRNGLYSIISIAGLAISLAVCSFILLWVQDEKSFDRFHKEPNRIYQAITHFNRQNVAELCVPYQYRLVDVCIGWIDNDSTDIIHCGLAGD